MPYNVERILLLASNLNTSKIALIMKTFEATSAVKISDELLQSVNDMITGIYLCIRRYTNHLINYVKIITISLIFIG